MTKNTELRALPRVETGKEVAGRLRTAGRIPAVLYGKDMESVGLSLDTQETEYLFHRISVENTIIQLAVDGEDEPVRALIREIQTYPHKDGILHVDFLRIQKGVKVELEIPVNLEGIPVGVRDFGGVLEQIINEIRVRCIPSLIPEAITIDVAELGIGDSVHVSEVDLDERVEILVDASQTVCIVAVPKIVAADVEEEEDEELEEGEEAADGEAVDGAEDGSGGDDS